VFWSGPIFEDRLVDWLRCTGFCSCRFSHLHLSRALSIVKANPVIDDPFRLETVGNFTQIDGLLLQGSPQSFNKDVVQITPPDIHWDFDFGISQSYDPARARILAALICVHDLWLAVFGNSLLQRLNTEASIQRIWELPSQHFSRRPIHDCH